MGKSWWIAEESKLQRVLPIVTFPVPLKVVVILKTTRREMERQAITWEKIIMNQSHASTTLTCFRDHGPVAYRKQIHKIK